MANDIPDRIANMTTFHASKKQGRANIAWLAGVAVVAAPVLMFGKGFHDIPSLIAGTIGAGALALAIYWVRGLVGGVKSITLSDDGVTISRKKGKVHLTWSDVTKARFETVNTTPWLTFTTAEKRKHRIGLEVFEEEKRKDITHSVMNSIPKKTTSTRSWILLNRVPISIVGKGVDVTGE